MSSNDCVGTTKERGPAMSSRIAQEMLSQGTKVKQAIGKKWSRGKRNE